MRFKKTPILLLTLAAALAAPSTEASAIPPPLGGLTPVPGGCLTETATAGCTTDPGAGDVTGVAVRPGGAVLYVVQGGSGSDNSNGAVMAYARDAQTGKLGARISCRAYDPTNLPGCVGDSTLYLAHGLAVAPDGHGIYVTSTYGSLQGSLISFATDPATGAIGEPTSCFEQNGALDCGAVPYQAAHGLEAPRAVAVSPDGKAVYTAAANPRGGVAAFARLASDGSLTAELRCASGEASPGGDAGPGKCDLPVDSAVDSASAIAVTNKAVYVSSDGSFGGNGDVVAYGRDLAAGTLTGRLNCFSESTFPGCSGRFGLVAPQALAAAPDGKTLYAAGLDAGLSTKGGQLTTIRLASDGSLSLVAGCLGSNAQDTCTKAPGVRNVQAIALSSDGGQLYAADTSDGFSGSLTAFGLTQSAPSVPPLSCLTSVATAGCTTLATLRFADAIALSPNGHFVYVGGKSSAGSGTGLIQAFTREVPPSCSNVSATTVVGTAVSIPLACSDPNGDPLTLSSTGAPSHGALGAVDQSARTVTYAPAAGYVGPDSFTYTASDGRAAAPAAGTASIDVTAAPPAPGPAPGPDPSPGPGPDPGPNPGPAAPTCKVPKLIGLHLAKAKRKLSRAHCKLGKVSKPRHIRTAKLVVVKQSPKSGRNTTKRVTLSLGKPRKHNRGP